MHVMSQTTVISNRASFLERYMSTQICSFHCRRQNSVPGWRRRFKAGRNVGHFLHVACHNSLCPPAPLTHFFFEIGMGMICTCFPTFSSPSPPICHDMCMCFHVFIYAIRYACFVRASKVALALRPRPEPKNLIFIRYLVFPDCP